MREYGEARDVILQEITNALNGVDQAQVVELAKAVVASRKIFVVGVGRVLLSLQAFAKRMNHLGIPTWFVGEINEPAITPDDMLIVGSGSGESLFPKGIAEKAKKVGAKIAYIGCTPESTVGRLADLTVRIPAKTKLNLPDEVQSVQLMSSLFEQSLYLLLDTVALMICEDTGRDPANLWQYHANLE